MIIYNKRKFKNLPLRIIQREGANLFLVLFASVSIIITSCNKSSVIGLSVQPTNDLLKIAYIDTTTLLTKTVRVDSLRTDEMLIYTAEALLGKYRDPTFGMATASLYTQLGLSSVAPLFGVSPLIDSVVLCLVYDTAYYGNRNRVAQKINVYYVGEDINSTVSYYSNNTLNTYFDLAHDHKFIPNPTDSVLIDAVKLKPQLRIPLDKSLGQSMLDNPIDLATNLSFQTLLKGLYITTENTTNLSVGEGNILHFMLADPLSKLTLYYHSSSTDSTHFNLKKYDLTLNSVARFSHFNHDYSTVDVNLAAQLSANPPKQNDVAFIQSMSGVQTKIEFPYIMNWLKQGPIAIDKAELIVKVDLTATYQINSYAPPTQLLLFGINDDGTEYSLPDLAEGIAYYGGTYDPIAHEYSFNIGRYVQQVLMGKLHNNGLHLLAFNGAIKANRVVIGGGGSSPYQMKLNMTYTKLGRTMKPNANTQEIEVVRKVGNK